ncbi:MAG TPA: YciI family protein [Candidatus Aquilonibacter sp.]
MLYIGYAEDAPGKEEQRAALREEHLRYLHGKPKKIVLGGGLLDGDNARLGNCFVIFAESLAAAQAWFAEEPYNKAGLFASLEITRISRGVWNPELAANTK